MPRFAVLEHDHPHLHWDLLLESGAVALTWRLAEPPCRGVPFTAERIHDHRLLYLDYEGPISGNRGHVIRWDRGELAWQLQEEARVLVRLEGDQLRGRLRLAQTTGAVWEGILEAEGDTAIRPPADPGFD